MAHKRQEKNERKEIEIEKRLEKVEKFIAKLRPDTYNFLTNYIANQGKTLQQVNAVAMEMRDFINERGLMQEYQQWIVAKYPAQPDTVCPSCDGRGYVGDEEECPLCHPNKTQSQSEHNDTDKTE